MLFAELTEVVDPVPQSAALNMALDELLLLRATVPLLRVYRWERPAVSFGYFVRYAEVARQWPDRDLVRRWTGGGIVPHGADFTYSLVVPAGHPFLRIPSADSYRAIHEIIAALLQECGAASGLAPAAAEKVSDACFENAAKHDVVSDGVKIAGAAQRRTKPGMLHQGSVQHPSIPPNFGARLARSLAPVVQTRSLAPEELAQATEIAAARYARAEWLQKF